MAKLHLQTQYITESRTYAKQIAQEIQGFIDRHSTVTVERTICRILGMDGVDEFGVPIPNIVVDTIKQKADISRGVSHYIANLIIKTGLSPYEIGLLFAKKDIDLDQLKDNDIFLKSNALEPYIEKGLERMKQNKVLREQLLQHYGDKTGPLLYVIVATGNIYEDVTQAKAAAKSGADVIAVIRTTGQSLLDYVPFGATTEGFGGTYATQENFRIMRKALDEVGEQLGRYIRLVNYASGLCMPEIAAMGALERLDMMLNDSLYGILFRDINMQRTFVDQFTSRLINAYAGIIINTGEDNYLTTADAVSEAHTVLASQFINEQFANFAYMPSELQGLGHAFEIDPSIENGFLFEIAQAQMARQIFPNAPLKYMPPTKFKTGNIFKGHVQDALFNITTKLTNQRIHLLGMMTEAVHTPFMSDRHLSIENANYIFTTMKDFGEEIEFKQGGIIERRANEVLENATRLLKQISEIGMFKTIEQGIFAGIKRPLEGGKGLSGVFVKSPNYFNPVLDRMIHELKEGEQDV